MGETFRVRVLGTITVLLACVAAQVPWFTCHSDCQASRRPLWDFAAHHCHVEAPEAVHHHHGCRCGHHHHAPAEEPVDEDGHGPADHAIVTAVSIQPPASVSFDASVSFLLAHATMDDGGAMSPDDVTAVRVVTANLAAGPPPGLASVRLLL